MKGKFVWVPDPLPKPISASKWMPLADKYKLNICWNSKCVGTAAGHGLVDCCFWGEDWCSPDVGACVLALVEKIKEYEKENKA